MVSYYGFRDYDDYLDARDDALRDEADMFAVECADCGTRWDPRWHRATRWDPAYEDQPECPECGGNERID